MQCFTKNPALPLKFSYLICKSWFTAFLEKLGALVTLRPYSWTATMAAATQPAWGLQSYALHCARYCLPDPGAYVSGHSTSSLVFLSVEKYFSLPCFYSFTLLARHLSLWICCGRTESRKELKNTVREVRAQIVV